MTSSSPIKKRSARRCLFGRPDPQKLNELLNSQLDDIKKKQNEKWGFDFDHLCPLPGSSSAYDFVALGIGQVPEYYRPTVLMTPVKCQPSQEKSPSLSPSLLDSSMECSDQELLSPPKRKSPKKRRSSTQTRIIDIFEIKRKYTLTSKTVEPVVPTSPGCPLPMSL